MKFRNAKLEDVSLIFNFLQKKAEYDRGIGVVSGDIAVTPEKIHKTLFGNNPFSYVFFAELSGSEVGFALYGFRYHSYAGQPSLWLEDLYVDEEMRGQSVANAMMNRLVQIAKEHDCSHIAWHADARNEIGLAFYRRLGAEITLQKGNDCFFKWVKR